MSLRVSRRGVPIALLALLLTFIGAGAIARLVGDRLQARVYTVAEVRAHLTDGPTSWVGREELVRASVEPCPWWGSLALQCGGRPLVLVDVDPENPGDPLPVERAAPSGLLVMARRLPLVGRLLPPPRPLLLLTPAYFRVQLEALPPNACGHVRCYVAVLLDGTP